MPMVDNKGVNIYFELDGNESAPPLVLSHWFMGSYYTWYDTGWVRVLSPHFKLIIIDHRGYGNSSKLYSPEDYHPKKHVSDIEAVLTFLEINKTHFFGYSMGGRIGFALMAYAPQKLLSAVIGGMHPYASNVISTNLDERLKLLQQGMKTILTAYNITSKIIFDRMLQNDAQALYADTLQTKKWKGLDKKILSFSSPVLLFVGMQDGFYEGLKDFSNKLKHSRFIAFRNENHRTAFLKRSLLIPHLSRFYNKNF